MIIDTKICSKCKEEKIIDEFRKGGGRLGRKAYCKPCDDANSRRLYEENKEHRKNQVAEWNEENPEKVKKYTENWKKKNKNSLPNLDF